LERLVRTSGDCRSGEKEGKEKGKKVALTREGLAGSAGARKRGLGIKKKKIKTRNRKRRFNF
jgi:hypothetical protein